MESIYLLKHLKLYSEIPGPLSIPLFHCTGFPKDYKLVGNQTEQKKFIGNAVEVNQAKALVQCNYLSLLEYQKRQSA